jgi:hypothetical protein
MVQHTYNPSTDWFYIIIHTIVIVMSQDNAVGIVTGYGLDD